MYLHGLLRRGYNLGPAAMHFTARIVHHDTGALRGQEHACARPSPRSPPPVTIATRPSSRPAFLVLLFYHIEAHREGGARVQSQRTASPRTPIPGAVSLCPGGERKAKVPVSEDVPLWFVLGGARRTRCAAARECTPRLCRARWSLTRGEERHGVLRSVDTPEAQEA